jgi:hypothetical protein
MAYEADCPELLRQTFDSFTKNKQLVQNSHWKSLIKDSPNHAKLLFPGRRETGGALILKGLQALFHVRAKEA